MTTHPTHPTTTGRPPEVRTPCSEPNACEDGDLCARHETEQAHAEGEHSFCGPTCEVEFPTELLRNGILAKGYPGTAGMLDELLRRAAAGQPADAHSLRAAVLREAADEVFSLDFDQQVMNDEDLGSVREAWDLGTVHARDELLRMADGKPVASDG